MKVLMLKIPEELDAALQAASRARGLSKSAVVREALEQSLGRQADQAGTAERWVVQWRGRLSATASAGPGKAKANQQDDRVAHLLTKHGRF